MLGRFLAVACLVLVVLGGGGPAAAQGKPDYDAARRHYLAAKEAQAKGDHEGAIRAYILAYDITKDPSLFKQIGTAYEGAGKKTEALVYYRRYLSEAKAGPDADEVRAKIAALEGTSTPAPAPAPAPPEAEPPKLPPERPPTASPALEPLPPVPPAPTLMEDPAGGWQRTAGWVSVGLAAVAVTTGAVLATSSASREEDLRQLVEFREPGTRLPSRYTGSVRDDYEEKDDEGKRLGRLATYSFAAAGVLAGAAVVFFVLDATRDVEAPAVTLAPAIGPDGVGAALGWEF
jgi:tetratricopeptide (TPR) repeat protein